MSSGHLSARNRSASSVSIRKRILRPGSEDSKEIAKNSTAASFRPKLQRLIQQNKLGQIIYSDPHTKADLFYKTHINEMERQLAQARKSLSTMVLKSKAKQYSINKLKHQLKKLQHESVIIRTQTSATQQSFKNRQQKLGQIKESLEQMMWKEKSYCQIKSRLYVDQKTFVARHDWKERDYGKLKKQLIDLETKFYQLSQFNKELAKMVDQARKISKEQAVQKNQFIDLLNNEMEEKDCLDDLKAEKRNRDREINELAASQIEKEELAKYMQIMFTHRALGQIIKVRSNRLLNKYHDLQGAYMYIKSTTNVSDLGKILYRMEQQDQAYEDALKRVSQLEIELNKIGSQTEDSVTSLHQLYSMGGGEYVRNDNEHYLGLAQDQHELLLSEKEQLLDRKRNDEILNKKIVMWAEDYFPSYRIRQDQTKDFLICLQELADRLAGKQTVVKKKSSGSLEKPVSKDQSKEQSKDLPKDLSKEEPKEQSKEQPQLEEKGNKQKSESQASSQHNAGNQGKQEEKEKVNEKEAEVSNSLKLPLD